mmetsp:Transcript_115746/g.327311  ORF Transcript_115746/g.327311 Transcript_115746/m.327311 type:complete len:439 (-) Transcript_115746:138-1454(-)
MAEDLGNHRTQQCTSKSIPLKVKNTFIEYEDEETDCNVEDFRRQISEPAAVGQGNYMADASPVPFAGGTNEYPSPFGGVVGAAHEVHQMHSHHTDMLDGFMPGMPIEGKAGKRRQRIDKLNMSAALAGIVANVDMLEQDVEPMRVQPLDPFSAHLRVPGRPDGLDLPGITRDFPTVAPIKPPPEWANTTTVMMRNLPNKYSQRMLLMEINHTGFLGSFDFLYLPIDPETAANRGYSFLNFIDPGYAWMFKLSYEGHKMKRFNSNKVVSIVPATLQGFEANYAHYSMARVSRGDPAARPLFLREPKHLPGGARGAWAGGTGQRGGRRRNNVKSNVDELDSFTATPDGVSTDMAVAWSDINSAYFGLDESNADYSQGFASANIEPKVDVTPFSVPSDSPAMAKFCPHCGAPIQPMFLFCPRCGQSLDHAFQVGGPDGVEW